MYGQFMKWAFFQIEATSAAEKMATRIKESKLEMHEMQNNESKPTYLIARIDNRCSSC